MIITTNIDNDDDNNDNNNNNDLTKKHGFTAHLKFGNSHLQC